MLHLRVICTPEQTDAVLKVLDDQPGVTHVILGRGAAIRPEGDAIQADVARETANAVIDRLEELGIQHDGGITLESLETILSESATKAEKDAPGDPDDAVVWAELMARTREESTLNVTFLSFLTIACLLAMVGVVTDSAVTIVGAMVVGPEFGPLAALAVGINRRNWTLAKRSMIALFVGFPVAMGITWLVTFCAEAVGLIALDSVGNIHEVDFIYRVGPFSLLVALLAGAAGMLALVSSKSAALVGVFISVTTVPAAGFAVVAATLNEWSVARDSAIQLAVNLVGMVIAGLVVLAMRPKNSRRTAPLIKVKRKLLD